MCFQSVTEFIEKDFSQPYVKMNQNITLTFAQ